jgi:hypothetical protein
MIKLVKNVYGDGYPLTTKVFENINDYTDKSTGILLNFLAEAGVISAGSIICGCEIKPDRKIITAGAAVNDKFELILVPEDTAVSCDCSKDVFISPAVRQNTGEKCEEVYFFASNDKTDGCVKCGENLQPKISAEISELYSEIKSLKAELIQYKTDIDALTAKTAAITEVTDDYSSIRKNYLNDETLKEIAEYYTKFNIIDTIYNAYLNVAQQSPYKSQSEKQAVSDISQDIAAIPSILAGDYSGFDISTFVQSYIYYLKKLKDGSK